MSQRSKEKAEQIETMAAAVSGGLAAIIGGIIFVGGLVAVDFHGIATLSAKDGWVRPLAQLGGIVGCFGILGFAIGPILAASRRKR